VSFSFEHDPKSASSFATDRLAADRPEAPPEIRNGFQEADLTGLTRQFYADGNWLMRKKMHYRIHICPFERLLTHVQPGSAILDVGCGAGLFLALVAGSVSNVTGIGFDTSTPAIKTARRMAEQVRAAGIRAELDFKRLDAADPWPSGQFDLVSLIDVVHHISPSHHCGLLSQAARSLKPGGHLLYKDMADRPFFHAGMNRLHDLVFARQWINYAPISSVEQWARESGLELTHSENLTRMWYQHELRVFRKRAV
jgi:cyclopropane fatty-acyl-phospholipid synthase-like methyltransferase